MGIGIISVVINLLGLNYLVSFCYFFKQMIFLQQIKVLLKIRVLNHLYMKGYLEKRKMIVCI